MPQPYDAQKIVYVPYENTEGGWVWSKQIDYVFLYYNN